MYQNYEPHHCTATLLTKETVRPKKIGALLVRLPSNSLCMLFRNGKSQPLSCVCGRVDALPPLDGVAER